MNSCFCFSTSGSLSNPPQEKAQLKWCGRLHRLFLYHLVKTDIIMETKAYLLKRKHFQSPRWNHSLPDVGKYIPSIIHYCNWFSVWVIKVIIFLASAIDRSLAQPAVLSAWAASFPNPLTTSHTCWTSAVGPSSDVTSLGAFPCPRQKDCSFALSGFTALCSPHIHWGYKMINCRVGGLPELARTHKRNRAQQK